MVYLWHRMSLTSLCACRSRNAISNVKQPWKKRQLKRAEKTAMKLLEKELKETAEKEREVQYIVHLFCMDVCIWMPIVQLDSWLYNWASQLTNPLCTATDYTRDPIYRILLKRSPVQK